MKKLTKSQLIKIIKEEIDDIKLGKARLTKSSQAKAEKDRAKDIASGKTLDGVDTRERGMIQDIEKILTQVAEADDLNKYRQLLQNLLARIRNHASKSKSIQSGEKNNP